MSGAISGVIAAALIGVFAWAWRQSRPTPEFELSRMAGSWMLLRTEHSTAVNVQWTVSDEQGMSVFWGGPQSMPPDMARNEMELIGCVMRPDYQLVVMWGTRDRTNSHAVTIRSGVADYEVYAIGRRPRHSLRG